MLEYEVFKFSNENLTAYQQLYDFNGARVLSIGGSGDQYFTAILNGAEEVTLFDKNPYFWPYFVAKFCAIQNLSYGEFCELFIRKATFHEIFQEVESLLSSKERSAIRDVIKKNFIEYQIGYLAKDIKRMILADCVPYLQVTRYKELQQKLQGRSLPDVYFSDIRNLPKEVGDKSYDIMLASNIYQWISREISARDYLCLLNNFNCQTFQAMYSFCEFPPYSLFNEMCTKTPVKGWWAHSQEIDYVYTYQKK